MIAFNCPKCSTALAIPPEKAGIAMVRCPRCGERISIPKKKQSVTMRTDIS